MPSPAPGPVTISTASTSRAMKSKCSAKRVEPDHVQPDAVGHLEAARLAQVLHQAHDVAGQAPLAQVVVEGQVEGHHLAALARDGEALLAPDPQLHVVGCQLDRLARRGRP